MGSNSTSWVWCRLGTPARSCSQASKDTNNHPQLVRAPCMCSDGLAQSTHAGEISYHRAYLSGSLLTTTYNRTPHITGLLFSYGLVNGSSHWSCKRRSDLDHSYAGHGFLSVDDRLCGATDSLHAFAQLATPHKRTRTTNDKDSHPGVILFEAGPTCHKMRPDDGFP